MVDQLRLVVGLGNPGSKYLGTRHNIGFMALERLASRDGLSFRQQAKLHGLAAEQGLGQDRLRLLMPQTFMNDSGRSIRAALDWFGFSPGQLLILVDDMDIPLGRLRLRAQGSAGGHNGLRSTIQHLGPRPSPAFASASVPHRRIPPSVGSARCPTCSVPSVGPSGPRWMPCWMVCSIQSGGSRSMAWNGQATGSMGSGLPWTDDGAPRHNGPPARPASVRQRPCVEGEVSAGGFQWTFIWAFDRGELTVEPWGGR